VFADDVLGLRKDTLEAAAGERFERTVVEYRPAGAAIALDAASRILLVKHYRHPVERFLWELPGGMIEADEDACDCALRELWEETGYRGANPTHWLNFHPEPAFTNHVISLVKVDCQGRPGRPPIAEAELGEAAFFDLDQALRMTQSGEIGSSWSVIGVLLARTR
jgi:8-oxo-dGTP pyrophosphatase MutT (NUDIX family)